jgi:hypothetical protein
LEKASSTGYINDGNYDFSSWNIFERRFRETFEARRKLWTVCQGSRTSKNFFLEFEEIRLEADICENSVIMFLQAALRPSILQEVLCRDPSPISYIDWKTASLRADHNQQSSAATKSFHQHSFPPQPRQNTFIPFCSRFNFNNQLVCVGHCFAWHKRVLPFSSFFLQNTGRSFPLVVHGKYYAFLTTHIPSFGPFLYSWATLLSSC